MSWASARCKSQYGQLWRGMAWHGWARQGSVRRGRVRAADGSTEGQPSLLLSSRAVGARRGAAWLGLLGLGAVR